MNTSVEISYYPLNQEYVPPIREFIDRLNQDKRLVVRTNGMSSQIFGKYDDVMEVLCKEIKDSFSNPHSVFVMKVINADLDVSESK
ncbi:MAG: YkoF family thiamine/hydroxymethylpyrimidine-binding protein [Bacteroidota bacterium]|nr:YkoF family thiamine/hydroxymethylpyrimidine-binding protein [Bacteroidota bacterium]